MDLKLQRKRQIFDCTKGEFFIDGKKECDTLEDVHHDNKIFGQTRIPAGTYEIALNKTAGMNKRTPYLHYSFHTGMLELLKVPNYTCVFIHIGNYAKDTEGCVLVGIDVENKAMIGQSTATYDRVYKKISAAILKGDKCTLTILDEPHVTEVV